MKETRARSVWREAGYWTVYGVLVAVRLVLALVSTGYIHPDEFFQNPEASAALVFRDAQLGCAQTWEFRAPQIRSITLPALTTGLPFALLRTVWRALSSSSETELPPPVALFWTPRIAFFCYSLVLDACVVLLGRWYAPRLRWRRALLCLASAWPVLAFAVRPFSNTTELLLLAALVCAVADPAPITPARAVLVPALGALGVFNRATFVAFAAPLAAFHVYRCLRCAPTARACAVLGVSAAALGAAVAALVASDTRLYTGRVRADALVLAPLNFVRYNADAANLARHGTHPRWLHAAVNVPLLALPLLPRAARAAVRTWTRPGRRAALPALCSAVVACALAVLSAAPHQELRFVLPLVFPLVILACWDDDDNNNNNNSNSGGDDKTPARPRCRCRGVAVAHAGRVALWAAFNMVLAAYFGFAQQGGVVPALAHIGTHMRAADAAPQQQLVFWHTYMPPPHLLAAPRTRYALTDLADAPLAALVGTVDAVLANATATACTDVWVAAPALEHEAASALATRGLVRTAAFVPHVGLDNGEAAAFRAAFRAQARAEALEQAAALCLFRTRVGQHCAAVDEA